MPPCGGHPGYKLDSYDVMCVSSRAPVWGASNSARYLLHDGVVSSRAPVWGASVDVSIGHVNKAMFQVVPPCGGHLKHPDRRNLGKVSSRAPVWGASQDFPHSFSDRIVSSRAPVWGASGALPFQDIENMSFKSCPRVGGILYYSQILEPL